MYSSFQIRKSDCANAMSAFPLIATELRTSREVRLVPQTDIGFALAVSG
jgi:hypothetical protein